MQSKSNRSHLLLALVPLLFLLISCGDKDDSKEAVGCDATQAAVSSASYSELWTKVFSTQCKACHGNADAQGTEGGPDMTTADLFYSGLVGKKGTDYNDWDTFQNNRVTSGGGGCGPSYFIEAGSASTSMVVAVLDPATTIAGCSPLKSHVEAPQNICITAGNLAKLKEWINAGASK